MCYNLKEGNKERFEAYFRISYRFRTGMFSEGVQGYAEYEAKDLYSTILMQNFVQKRETVAQENLLFRGNPNRALKYAKYCSAEKYRSLKYIKYCGAEKYRSLKYIKYCGAEKYRSLNYVKYCSAEKYRPLKYVKYGGAEKFIIEVCKILLC